MPDERAVTGARSAKVRTPQRCGINGCTAAHRVQPALRIAIISSP
jgi:hypothetical protein